MAEKKLSAIIEMAKGNNRTLRQFARDADIDPSVISRMIKSDYIPGIKTLQKISTAADLGSNLKLSDFLEAAGYGKRATESISDIAVKNITTVALGITAVITAMMTGKNKLKVDKILEEQPAVTKDIVKQQVKSQRLFKTTALSLIFQFLTENEIEWRQGLINNLKTYGNAPDEYILLEHYKYTSWWLVFWAKPEQQDDQNMISCEDQAHMLFSRFTTEAADPNRKISIVVDDQELFNALENLKGRNSFRGDQSVILIDMDNLQIIKESVISSYEKKL